MAFRSIFVSKEISKLVKNNVCRGGQLSPRVFSTSSGSLNKTDLSSNQEKRTFKSLTGNHRHPDLNVNFDDGKEAYRSKTMSELVRALIVFNLCSVDVLVNNQKQLLQWSRKLLGARLFNLFMRKTFYGHFVAGEDKEEIKPVARRIRQFGVKSILDYSAEEDLSSEEAKDVEMEGFSTRSAMTDIDTEIHNKFTPTHDFGDRREGVTSARTFFYEGEAQCDKNMDIILRSIDAVTNATEKSGFAAIKLTALGKPQLLMQMSEVLITVQNFFRLLSKQQGTIDSGGLRLGVEDFDNRLKDIGVQLNSGENRKWVSVKDISSGGCEIDLLDWSNLLEINRSLSKLLVVPNLMTGKSQSLMDSMSVEEEDQMKNMLRRVNKVAEYAKEKEVRVMVDAEQSYFQPAIRRLTMEMMRKFNTERSVIFNTYQNYTKTAFNDLVVDLDLARHEDFYFGAKLVRGAYMEQERERAAQLGYEDPINPTYEATSQMMHSVIEEVMRQIHLRPVGKIAVMVASHSEDTVRFTIEKMKEYGIGPDDRLICFGQLFGMCDQVSFPLGQAGYSVYKYVPFGPVEEVLPYLSRRAHENKGIIAKVKKEKKLLRKEIFRRITGGEMFAKPVPPANTTPAT